MKFKRRCAFNFPESGIWTTRLASMWGFCFGCHWVSPAKLTPLKNVVRLYLSPEYTQRLRTPNLRMEYLGDKLSVAHSQVSGWMGNVRRSFQGAVNMVSTSVERRTGRGGGEEEGDFKRAASLRSLASRSRESFRRFSLRSQQRFSMRRRTTSLASPSTPSSVRETIYNLFIH